MCSYSESIDRIGQPGYVPTDQDILRSRVWTTGITATTFTVGECSYRIYDAGGAVSERRKWIHCNDNVDVIVFVVDISAYDKRLLENSTVNRLVDSINLFESLCDLKRFTRTSMILCLNKVDSLEKKLATSPIKKYCPDYDGNSRDLDAVKIYFRDKFCGLNKHFYPCIRVFWASAVDGPTAGRMTFDLIKNSSHCWKSPLRMAHKVITEATP